MEQQPRPKLEYDAATRDLARLASERVSEALASVLQLADTSAQRYAIAQTATMTAFGISAGLYDQWQGNEENTDALTYAVVILALMDEHRKLHPPVPK